VSTRLKRSWRVSKWLNNYFHKSVGSVTPYSSPPFFLSPLFENYTSLPKLKDVMSFVFFYQIWFLFCWLLFVLFFILFWLISFSILSFTDLVSFYFYVKFGFYAFDCYLFCLLSFLLFFIKFHSSIFYWLWIWLCDLYGFAFYEINYCLMTWVTSFED